MKAFTRTRYGGPELLHLEEVDKPVVKEGQLLVKVFANSINPADWHILRGEPFFARFVFGLLKPKDPVIGADFAGMVVETGEGVQQFKSGDRVFGETLKGGAFAEYVLVPQDSAAIIPDQFPFTEMAALPVAGLTALQALVTFGKLKKDERVLINGGSGGVGHFAIQIAKNLGGIVTAVCSAKNADFVKKLGADKVIEYDKENIHQHKGQYELVIDCNGNLFYNDYKRMGKRGVMIGFTSLKHMISLSLKKATGKFPLAQFTAAANTKDLQTLALLMKEKKLIPHIETVYSYREIPTAIREQEAMRTRGKRVIDWKKEPN